MKEVFDKIIGFIHSEIARTTSYAEHDTLINVKFFVEGLAEEYNNGWIACSERLPEYTDDYNVTVGVCNELGYYECVKTFRFVNIKGTEPRWEVPEDDFAVYNVIAWQPLPAPYQPKEDK